MTSWSQWVNNLNNKVNFQKLINLTKNHPKIPMCFNDLLNVNNETPETCRVDIISSILSFVRLLLLGFFNRVVRIKKVKKTEKEKEKEREKEKEGVKEKEETKKKKQKKEKTEEGKKASVLQFSVHFISFQNYIFSLEFLLKNVEFCEQKPTG